MMSVVPLAGRAVACAVRVMLDPEGATSETFSQLATRRKSPTKAASCRSTKRTFMNSVNILRHMHLAGQAGIPLPDRHRCYLCSDERGYAMAALLIGMSVMAVLMTVAMPVWKQAAIREKEAELVFRGEQYKRAIDLFQRKSGPGTIPPSLDILVDQKFLRKKYKDPITGQDFDLISPNTAAAGAQPNQPGRGGPPPSRGTTSSQQPQPLSGRSSQPGGTIGVQGGIVGVASKSKATSIRLYNGRNHYNEWQFVFVARQQTPGGPGGPGGPGQRGGPGGPGQRGGPGGPGQRGGPGGGRNGQAPPSPFSNPQRGGPAPGGG